ncbi:Monosaccharide-sensing 2-like protein [Quillaja saponaria]|uniref:Monosaccharide-sensing 2-like protein n=1 Tax=Quillaja saponaria TaxID=32244 RepID=A0AAD7KQU2_QUISA|nr:Monosaccharide-sensing 2-like protein [Quillaja saponaria]
MRGVVLVALAATLGNVLQGWDNSTIAGALIYVKKELNLETKPALEGLIVAMSLIGATFITTFSGTLSDWLGRRPMLIISSLMYFLSGLIMLWAPNVYVVLFARLIDGFGIGLAVTLIPVYISETAPSDIRGRLNTLPQFAGSCGMFLSYCMVFVMSLTDLPSWRLMLGVVCVPSIIYFVLTVFYLPESPRWLVSKGRMLKAKQVKLALLIEGLGIGAETSIEEYLITPANELNINQETDEGKDYIKLYGPDESLSLVAKPVTGQITLSMRSQHRSFGNQNPPLKDPLVTLIRSFHENISETGSTYNLVLPNVSRVNSMSGHYGENEQWDVENQGNHEADASDASRPTYTSCKGVAGNITHNTNIGGGWQLVWKLSERVREDGKREGGFQKVYLHQEGTAGSHRDSFASIPGGEMPVGGEVIQAAALRKVQVGEIMLEPGVKRALYIGVGLQMLQQVAGINGVLYFAPQILKEGRSCSSSVKYGHKFNICLSNYKRSYNIVNASLYRSFHVVDGYCWTKVNYAVNNTHSDSVIGSANPW